MSSDLQPTNPLVQTPEIDTTCTTMGAEDIPNGLLHEIVLPEPPDGGRAWIIVLGSTLALFSTTGVINAYGFFHFYYTDVLLPHSSSATISLIGALQICFVYAGAPITGKLFDVYGSKVLLPVGSLLTVLSLMLVSLCQKDHPYQFFLIQSVMSGFGISMIFTPAVAVIGHWFKRHRCYALGITIAGSSLGGVVYPIILQQLQVKVGFRWAVRIAGFTTLACLIITSFTVKTRLPLRNEPVLLSQLVDLSGFHDIRYTLATISSFLYFYAIFIPYFYIEEYAKLNEVSPHVTPYLLAIMNGCAIPARIIPGPLADRFGVLPVLLPSSVLAGGIVLALWLPSRGSVPVVLFSALYGLFSSSFVSMLPAYIATISPADKFGARLGTYYFSVAAASLVGTPTAGAFVPTSSREHFDSLIIFTGVLLLTSSTFIGLTYGLSIWKEWRDTGRKSAPSSYPSTETTVQPACTQEIGSINIVGHGEDLDATRRKKAPPLEVP